MAHELTTATEREPSGPRIACSDSRSASTPTNTASPARLADRRTARAPERVGESDHQGAWIRSARTSEFFSTTAAVMPGGGASQSKWTRRTRPRNASISTAVVDLFHAGPRSALEVYSGGEAPEPMAGGSLGEPRRHAVRKDSRIHGSPVRFRPGRGRPRAPVPSPAAASYARADGS